MSNIIKINEMFPAIQGEGLTNGLPVYFVRTSGCNLNCDFCDTKYHKQGDEYNVTDVVDKIRDSKLEGTIFKNLTLLNNPEIILDDTIYKGKGLPIE